MTHINAKDYIWGRHVHVRDAFTGERVGELIVEADDDEGYYVRFEQDGAGKLASDEYHNPIERRIDKQIVICEDDGSGGWRRHVSRPWGTPHPAEVG